MINKLLRIIRIAVSISVFTILTAGMVCSALMLPVVGRWLERIQFVNAVMYLSLGIFVAWMAITLLFGRVYCSTVCPMGTLQDISARVAHMGRKGRNKVYRYRRPDNALRYVMLLVTLVSLMGGLALMVSVLDPFEAYHRICRGFFCPVTKLAVRAIESAGITCPSGIDTMIISTVAASIIATTLFVATVIISAQHGRLICNTVCPVGTTLGLISRFSVFQIDIDTDKCTQCRKCSDVCKSECIDLADHVVDGSRCVNCFNCINVCPDDAIRYTTRRKRLSIPMMQRISGPAANNAAIKSVGQDACIASEPEKQSTLDK